MPPKRMSGNSDYYQWPWSVSSSDSVYVFGVHKNKKTNWKLGSLVGAAYRGKLLKSSEGRPIPALLITTHTLSDQQNMGAEGEGAALTEEETYALCLANFIPRHASQKWQTNDMLVDLYEKEYAVDRARVGGFIKTYIAREISTTQDESHDFTRDSEPQVDDDAQQQPPAVFNVAANVPVNHASRLAAPSQPTTLPPPRKYYTFALVTSCLFEIYGFVVVCIITPALFDALTNHNSPPYFQRLTKYHPLWVMGVEEAARVPSPTFRTPQCCHCPAHSLT